MAGKRKSLFKMAQAELTPSMLRGMPESQLSILLDRMRKATSGGKSNSAASANEDAILKEMRRRGA